MRLLIGDSAADDDWIGLGHEWWVTYATPVLLTELDKNTVEGHHNLR